MTTFHTSTPQSRYAEDMEEWTLVAHSVFTRPAWALCPEGHEDEYLSPAILELPHWGRGPAQQCLRGNPALLGTPFVSINKRKFRSGESHTRGVGKGRGAPGAQQQLEPGTAPLWLSTCCRMSLLAHPILPAQTSSLQTVFHTCSCVEL